MRVEPGSPADLAGIVAGDVIAGVGTGAVNDVREATRAIRQAQQEGRAVLLRVFRDGRAAFVAIDVAPPGKGRVERTIDLNQRAQTRPALREVRTTAPGSWSYPLIRGGMHHG